MMSRKFTIKDRNAQSRKSVSIEQFTEPTLESIKNDFDSDIQFVSELFRHTEQMIEEGKQKEAENLWRLIVSQTESCMDFYIHQLCKFGIVAMFRKDWEQTQRFKNCKITISDLYAYQERIDDSSVAWLLKAVTRNSCSECYLGYDKLTDQLNLLNLSVKTILREYYPDKDDEHRKPDQVVNSIYDRRNKIVHQNDRRHADATIIPISKDEVTAVLTDIPKIVELIHHAAVTRDKSKSQNRS